MSLFNRSPKKDDEGGGASVNAKEGGISIVLCQDAQSVARDMEAVGALLREEGYNVTVDCVEDRRQLKAYLDKLEKKKLPAPNAVFMDVCGVGSDAAEDVIKWFDKNRAGTALPRLHFLSLSADMAIGEAGVVAEMDERVSIDFVDPNEPSWLKAELKKRNGHEEKKKERDPWNYGPPSTPMSTGLRDTLTTLLGVQLPMKFERDEYYEKKVKAIREVSNARIFRALQRGKIPVERALERLRPYATGVATALKDGFYGQQGQVSGLQADAKFYSSAGYPVKGPVVFSLAEVEQSTGPVKPVLVMQSYDPAVVPVLASGKLGGLVVTSPYMASHLKLLCETHMVSGLFGAMAAGQKGLATEFNEEAKPDLPPYFEGATAEVAGQTIKNGQQVLVALDGNGMTFNPPASYQAAKPLDVSDLYRRSRGFDDDYDYNRRTPTASDRLSEDVENLRQVIRCLATVLADNGQKPHTVKANIDSSNSNMLRTIGGIGLVRTEQMVATNLQQVSALKSYLLRKEPSAFYDLKTYMTDDYRAIITNKLNNAPVKIRLFDFVHSEILNKDEQAHFVNLYKKMDIHGGEALATWTELYQAQVASIFAGMKPERNRSGYEDDYFSRPRNPSYRNKLEIMMPAVKTEADVLAIKAIVEAEAEKAFITPEQYSFGVMAETLDVCKNIAAIAKHVDFISFGTNDLTQEFTGIARSDLVGQAKYAEKNGINPFKVMAPAVLDIMEKTIAEGRKVKTDLKVDVCGAQAADPATAMSLYTMGVDNVSVAPTLSNLFALPVILGYQAYDALKASLTAANTAAPQQRKLG